MWYDVVDRYGRNLGGRREGAWTCTCRDYVSNKTICKHIYAVLFYKEQHRKRPTIIPSVAQSLPQLPIATDKIECPKCNTAEDAIVKNGKRNNKSQIIQRYLCRKCGHRFISNIGFEYSKKSPEVITAALDLYFKGVSLRKIADHIKQFYGVDTDPSSTLYWIRKFADNVGSYVNRMKPLHLGGIYQVDEMMVHVRKEKMEKGHYQWLWNLMDDQTRFWISSKISQHKELSDARAIFQDQKEKSGMPKAIIHDGLASYDDAWAKEYFTMKNPRVRNIRSISVRNQGLNCRVERLNGTMRDREKVMRGMHSATSAQTTIEAFHINYNFCKEHQVLSKTPTEAAGIHLNLGNNKIESLIRQAVAVERQGSSLEDKIRRHLGEERLSKIKLVDEKGAIKAIPREWIEFRKWREINDMLRVHGLFWLPNGKNSCWVKMRQRILVQPENLDPNSF